MAFPELFGALQTGVVDGQENPIPVILSAKFSQVQKHLSLTGHVYSPALLIVSPALWNKLSDADKKAFTEAGKAASAAQRKKVNDDERDGIAQLRAGGMEVVTAVDNQAFRNAMTPVWTDFAKQFGLAAPALRGDSLQRPFEFGRQVDRGFRHTLHIPYIVLPTGGVGVQQLPDTRTCLPRSVRRRERRTRRPILLNEFGGGGGSRTRVRKHVVKEIYMRIRFLFSYPA